MDYDILKTFFEKRIQEKEDEIFSKKMELKKLQDCLNYIENIGKENINILADYELEDLLINYNTGCDNVDN